MNMLWHCYRYISFFIPLICFQVMAEDLPENLKKTQEIFQRYQQAIELGQIYDKEDFDQYALQLAEQEFTFLELAPELTDSELQATLEPLFIYRRERALVGEVESQYLLGLSYIFNLGTTFNDEKAYNWFFSAARQGHAKAQVAYGELLVEGLVDEFFQNKMIDDIRESQAWFEAAAEQGYAEAKFLLSMSYLLLEEEPELVFKWMSEAAEQGHPDAQVLLAEYYFDGIGVEQDQKKALVLLEKAVKSREISIETKVQAWFILGAAYFNGLGTEQDLSKATSWYKKAALLGSPQAQSELGKAYYYGRGVEKNAKYANYWFCKALESGFLIPYPCEVTVE